MTQPASAGPTATAAPERRQWPIRLVAVAAAAALLAVGAAALPRMNDAKLVYAMETAVAKLDSYHAVVEHRRGDGANTDITREEFWVQGDNYHYERVPSWMRPEVVISDGEREWTILPNDRVALHGYPVAADLREWNPAAMARKVIEQPHKVEAEEIVAGRQTVRVTVAPPEGRPYLVWIDKETKLPLQYEMSVGNFTDTMTYSIFEVNPAIDPAKFAYAPPADFRVMEDGALVKTAEEAAQVAGFKPLSFPESPKRIIASKGSVVMDFGDARVEQAPVEPTQRLHIDTYGWSRVGPVQWLPGGAIMWYQDGLRITIHADRDGNRAVALARQALPDLTLPQEFSTVNSFNRQIKTDVSPDMKLAIAMEMEHANNPALHVERTNPQEVALGFLREKGAQVDAQALTPAANTAIEVVYTVSSGPIQRVYLRQAARNDGHGLWWVIGYDPR